MSLSKPVTAVALMQLVEQGQIDLHADANTYLRSVKLPEAFGAPVTADHLLTHSAGLDYDLDNIGTEAAEPAGLLGNARFLNEHPPARIFPPGQHFLYSNAAFDIAGQMVEDVSGFPFADYVEQHIFTPLGMARSSFDQPPPQPDGLVTGYEFDGESHQPLPLPLWQDPPSRSMTATAPDMARFMAALLGDGSPILQPGSVETLLDTHFTYRDGTAGSAYGWHDVNWPGVDAVSKDGGAGGALSRILLLPDQDTGFFLAYNLDDGFGLASEVTQAFLERRFPFEPQLPTPDSGAAERGQALAGVYRLTGYSHHTLAKLLRLPWPDYPRVTAQADGRLLVQFAPETATAHELIEVAPLHYRTSDGKLDYVFWQDAAGRPAGFAVGDFVTEKVAPYDTSAAHMLMLIAFVLVFLGSAVAGLVVSLRRPPASSLARRTLWLLTAIAALNAFFLVVFFVILQWVASGASDIAFNLGMPPVLAALVAVPLLTSVLAVVLLALWLAGWRRRALSGRGVTLVGSFVAVSLLFIPWLHTWNLLGFRW
jgi:CubicO group peptidase (beta-lactamase class C family)